MSISAFPPFSGFVAKSLTYVSGCRGLLRMDFCGLLIASAGVMEHSGIKIPYFAFFGRTQASAARKHRIMCLAMGATAVLCITIGWLGPALCTFTGHLPTSLTRISGIRLRNSSCSFAAPRFCCSCTHRSVSTGKASITLDSDWLCRRRLAPRQARGMLSPQSRFAKAE